MKAFKSVFFRNVLLAFVVISDNIIISKMFGLVLDVIRFEFSLVIKV